MADGKDRVEALEAAVDYARRAQECLRLAAEARDPVLVRELRNLALSYASRAAETEAAVLPAMAISLSTGS